MLMLNTETMPQTSIVVATIDGTYTSAQIGTFRDHVARILATGNPPSFLMEFQRLDLDKVSARVAWADLNAGELFARADKIAVLADRDWIANLGDLIAAVSHLQVETFDVGRRDEAVAWLMS